MTPAQAIKKVVLSIVFAAIPFAASAAGVADALRVSDDALLDRGTFLRASVTVLELSLDGKMLQGAYARPVPKAMQPYVRAAERKRALSLFGKNLGLSRTITRGEAVELLYALLGSPAAKTARSYKDVRSGSALEKAVRYALEDEWIKPDGSDEFGASRLLTAKEAKTMLRKAANETDSSISTQPGAKKSQTIVIPIKKKESVQVPQNDVLRAIWQLLNDRYLYQDKLDDKEAGYEAAEALVNSLEDPYTIFMRPMDAKEFQVQIDGEVSGIGAQVEYKDNALIIVSPVSGSPAEKAGLKSGDLIIQVDGEDLADLSFLEAVAKVRGPKGSKAVLRVRRDTSEFDITVTRDTIKVPEISISYQGDIAIVKLVQFGQTTDRELRPLLKEVQAKKPRGIVLDLRNNPGGLLHAAEIVLSNFLPEGSGVAQILSRDGNYTQITVDKPTIDPEVKMVVLVNKGSASASEIVAAALQDAKRATLLGEKTFGKGTVQQIIEFNDGSSMKMTIAEWLSPAGQKINGEGVTPDMVVESSQARDEQLLRALDLLR